MKCPYCGGKVELSYASRVYTSRRFKNNKKIKVWCCENYPTCDAYVGCHPGTEIPLGRLANKNLRFLKSEAHRQFDPIWKSGMLSRKDAYKWLADMLHIDVDDCHIGAFDVRMCNRVIKICARQENPELQAYRLEHYGYEQTPPMFTRGYGHKDMRAEK